MTAKKNYANERQRKIWHQTETDRMNPHSQSFILLEMLLPKADLPRKENVRIYATLHLFITAYPQLLVSCTVVNSLWFRHLADDADMNSVSRLPHNLNTLKCGHFGWLSGQLRGFYARLS
jgi:hypothetical protein